MKESFNIAGIEFVKNPFIPEGVAVVQLDELSFFSLKGAILGLRKPSSIPVYPYGSMQPWKGL